MSIKITAADMESKRQAVNHQIWLQRHVIGRTSPPAVRDRLRERLLADDATESEVEEAFRQRESCFIRVYLAMNYHRQMSIVNGRLEIRGVDASDHQDCIDPWNIATDDKPSLAATTWQQLNERMKRFKQ